MTTLVEMPLRKYPISINAFIKEANAALTTRLMSMMAMVGLDSWQKYFDDSLAKVAIALIIDLELTGGERRGRASDDKTEIVDTSAGSIAFDPNILSCT